jgi:hypothetical protein
MLTREPLGDPGPDQLLNLDIGRGHLAAVGLDANRGALEEALRGKAARLGDDLSGCAQQFVVGHRLRPGTAPVPVTRAGWRWSSG